MRSCDWRQGFGAERLGGDIVPRFGLHSTLEAMPQNLFLIRMAHKFYARVFPSEGCLEKSKKLDSKTQIWVVSKYCSFGNPSNPTVTCIADFKL